MTIALILNWNFNDPCQNSPRCCSQSSPGGWIIKLLDKYQRKIHWKTYDDL